MAFGFKEGVNLGGHLQLGAAGILEQLLQLSLNFRGEQIDGGCLRHGQLL